jgi:hypothetical protein
MLPWITALRVFNAGKPEWCVPRKGTRGHETVQRIRQGEKMKTPKELLAELEKKTQKPKTPKTSMRIDLK